MGRVINLGIEQNPNFISPNLESGIRNAISNYMGTEEFVDEIYDVMDEQDFFGAFEHIIDFSISCWEVKRVMESEWFEDISDEIRFEDMADIASVRTRNSFDIDNVRRTLESFSRGELIIFSIPSDSLELFLDIFDINEFEYVYNRRGMIYFSKDMGMQVKAIADCLPFVYRLDNFTKVTDDYTLALVAKLREKTLDFVGSSVVFSNNCSILFEEQKYLNLLNVTLEEANNVFEYLETTDIPIIFREYNDEILKLLVHKDETERVINDLKHININVLSVSEYSYKE